MSVMLPVKFQNRLEVIPQHLQFCSSVKGIKYGELLGALDLMSKEKAIVFGKEEFETIYGKSGVVGLRQAASKAHITFMLRIVEDKGKIYIFKNDKLPKKS